MRHAMVDSIQPSTTALILLHDAHLDRRRLDLPGGPIDHADADLGDAQPGFVGDPHGAMKAVPSAPFLEQVLAAQRFGVGCLRRVLDVHLQMRVVRHFGRGQRVVEGALGAAWRPALHGDAKWDVVVGRAALEDLVLRQSHHERQRAVEGIPGRPQVSA